jgi:hypothetical protein
LHDDFSLAVDRQQLGAACTPEPLKVGFRVSGKIRERTDVFWSDHGRRLRRSFHLRFSCESQVNNLLAKVNGVVSERLFNFGKNEKIPRNIPIAASGRLFPCEWPSL